MDTKIEVTKSMGLLTQVARGLLNQSNQSTVSQLGDRRSYIGMSDIGKGAECLRAAVANKLYGMGQPKPEDMQQWFQESRFDEIRQALKKQLILQRGHWFEAGIVQAFKTNGTRFFPQLEIDTVVDGTPIKAHLDLTLVCGGAHPAVRVLELKSTEHLPETLYAGYEMQLYGQLGFLQRFWSEPCFGLRSETGEVLYEKLTFPKLVKRHFNIVIPDSADSVDIEGWVLCLSMSDAKPFGPYRPEPTMFNYCVEIAHSIWKQAAAVSAGSESLQKIAYCRGFHPLCDWCSHQGSCPKFSTQELQHPVYGEMLKEVEELKQQKSVLVERISHHEERIRAFYSQANVGTDWLGTGDYRFRCTTINGRQSLDQNALVAELGQLLGEEKTQQLVNKYTKRGNSYQRLFIGKNSKGNKS
jgi:hypothetical protein